VWEWVPPHNWKSPLGFTIPGRVVVLCHNVEYVGGKSCGYFEWYIWFFDIYMGYFGIKL